MTIARLLAAVFVATVPMIAAGFVWPDGWPLFLRQVAIAAWGIGVVVMAERRYGTPHVLGALGFHRPRPRGVGVALAAGAALWLSPVVLPLVAGQEIGLRPGWPLLLLGVIVVNGLAEEVIHRAFLYRHLRSSNSAARATAIAAAVFGAQHLYLVATLGPVAGLASVALALALTPPFVALYEVNGRSTLGPAILHTSTNAPMMLAPPATAEALLLPHMAVILAALYGALGLLVWLDRRDRLARPLPSQRSRSCPESSS